MHAKTTYIILYIIHTLDFFFLFFFWSLWFLLTILGYIYSSSLILSSAVIILFNLVS